MQHSSDMRFAGPNPVFVDRSGDRRRVVGRISVGISSLVAAYGAALVTLMVMGVPVDAPRLPLAEHLPRAAGEGSMRTQAAQPQRAAAPPVRPARTAMPAALPAGPANSATDRGPSSAAATASRLGAGLPTTAHAGRREVAVVRAPAGTSPAASTRTERGTTAASATSAPPAHSFAPRTAAAGTQQHTRSAAAAAAASGRATPTSTGRSGNSQAAAATRPPRSTASARGRSAATQHRSVTGQHPVPAEHRRDSSTPAGTRAHRTLPESSSGAVRGTGRQPPRR